MAVPCFASPGALSVFRRGAFQTNVQLLRPALIATGRSFQASRIVTSSDMGSVMGSPNLVSPQEAHTLKESAVGWVHLDVRTVEEFADGHAPDSTNIPYLIRGGLSMSPNPDFMDQVATAVGSKDTKLLVSCASGKRSAMACAALEKEGYETLKDVDGGYSAWARDETLPVERS